jgi:hypothetical protein
MTAKLLATAALSISLAACGGAPPPTTEAAPSGEEAPQRRGSGIQLDSEIGALDEGKVMDVFQRATPKLSACFQKGARRLPYLAGAVSFKVRVDGEGKALYAYLKDSTLGDRTTEDCMLDVLKALRWPAPEGGREGIAGNENMQFDPGGDERPPVDWSEQQLGDSLGKAKAEISKCRSAAGASGIKATMYVEPDGKPKSVGVSTSDEKGEGAVRCVVEALSGITYPSPGSWAAKVSVAVD